MEVLPILRALWRQRILVVVGLVASVGIALMFGSRPIQHSGVATARLMLDTPKSELVHPDPDGADSLGWRTAILAHLMLTDDIRQRIAATLDVPAARVVIVDPVLDAPDTPTTLAVTASEAAAARPEPYSLTVRFDSQLPILTLEAHAPDPAAAAKLAAAGARELQAQAPTSTNPELQRYDISMIAPVEAKPLYTGGDHKVAAAIGMVLFIVWCSCLAIVSQVVRHVRHAHTTHAAPATH